MLRPSFLDSHWDMARHLLFPLTPGKVRLTSIWSSSQRYAISQLADSRVAVSTTRATP